MTEIVMRKRGRRLEPVDPMSEEDMDHLPADRDLLVSAKAPRNLRQHRLAWALAQKLAEACDYLHDREDAMDYLKIRAKHVRMIAEPSGKVHLIPRSIAFGSVDQVKFSRLFNRMVWVVCNEILPGLDEGALRAEIEAMVSGQTRHLEAA